MCGLNWTSHKSFWLLLVTSQTSLLPNYRQLVMVTKHGLNCIMEFFCDFLQGKHFFFGTIYILSFDPQVSIRQDCNIFKPHKCLYNCCSNFPRCRLVFPMLLHWRVIEIQTELRLVSQARSFCVCGSHGRCTTSQIGRCTTSQIDTKVHHMSAEMPSLKFHLKGQGLGLKNVYTYNEIPLSNTFYTVHRAVCLPAHTIAL